MRCILLFLFLCSTLSNATNNPICTNGFTLVNNKCWKLYSTPVTHASAEKTCTSFGGTLFTAKNAIDNRAMTSFLNNQGVGQVWMGLICYDNLRSKCYWDDEIGTAETYSNFASGFPSLNYGLCVYYSVSSGKWANEDCYRTAPFVCELPTTTPDDCPNNYNNYCYFKSCCGDLPTAQRYCESQCGNLVSIHSSNENRYIASIRANQWTTLGGMVSSNGYIFWTDGSPMDYNNLQKLGDGECMYMFGDSGDLYTDRCVTDGQFMCKRPTGVSCTGTPSPIPTVAPFPQAVTSCGNSQQMAPGRFTSPNYPSDYTNDLSCSYTLVTTGAKRIKLQFNSFTTEQDGDVVNVYDGFYSNNPLIATYSGSLQSFYVMSTGPFMYVTFTTDHSSVFQGFNATFTSAF